MRWDPVQYERFALPRLRPGLDLLRSLQIAPPQRIVDLGCGTGTLTVALSERWPGAETIGVDSSHEMLESARSSQSTVRWVEADLRSWSEDGLDLIFSNAALQWIENHRSLFPRLVGLLRPGGHLAVQIPANDKAPTHTIAARLAASERWHGRLAGSIRRSPVLSPETYVGLLLAPFREVDVWSTTYLHVLSGPDPVTEWVKGSLLRPVLARLNSDERRDFLEAYSAAARLEYPPQSDGSTLLPFTRIFLIGRERS